MFLAHGAFDVPETEYFAKAAAVGEDVDPRVSAGASASVVFTSAVSASVGSDTDASAKDYSGCSASVFVTSAGPSTGSPQYGQNLEFNTDLPQLVQNMNLPHLNQCFPKPSCSSKLR